MIAVTSSPSDKPNFSADSLVITAVITPGSVLSSIELYINVSFFLGNKDFKIDYRKCFISIKNYIII